MANQFLPFGTGGVEGVDVLSQSSYESDPQRLVGHQAGTARRELENKALKQTTSIAHALAEAVSNVTGQDILDNGDLATLTAQIQSALSTGSSGAAFPAENFVYDTTGGSVFSVPTTQTPSADDLTVSIDGLGQYDQIHYTYNSTDKTITFASAPPSGLKVKISVAPYKVDLIPAGVVVPSTTGLAVVTAVSQAAARTAIGAMPATQTWAFSDLTSHPTTLAGYGITDAEPVIASSATTKYWRGDKTFQTLNAAAIPDLGNSATRNVGTTAGTVAAGDDPRFAASDPGTISANLTFTGVASRILADYSNATIANRNFFKTSTTNGITYVGTIANGTATQSTLYAVGGSDPANAQRIEMSCIGGSVASLKSTYTGSPTSGTYLPMAFNVGGGDRLTIGASGSITVPDVYSNTVTTAPNVYVDSGGRLSRSTAVIDEQPLILALSDETTALTTGTAKLTFRAPFAMTLTQIPRASVNTASTSGIVTVDIKESGTTILGADKLTIDANEKTSVTAATPTTLADSAIADDAELTFDITVAGTGAKGLKVILYYRRA